jgi:hypothetical protein
MYCLEEIVRRNENAAARSALRKKTKRRCSFCGDAQRGIVIHSARLRDTRFIAAGIPAKRFLAGWYGTNSADAHDVLVESYFKGT